MQCFCSVMALNSGCGLTLFFCMDDLLAFLGSVLIVAVVVVLCFHALLQSGLRKVFLMSSLVRYVYGR